MSPLPLHLPSVAPALRHRCRRDAAESLLLLQLSTLDAEAKEMSGRYGLPPPDLTLSSSDDDDDDVNDVGDIGASHGDGGSDGGRRDDGRGGGGGGGVSGDGGGDASDGTREHGLDLRNTDETKAAGLEVNLSLIHI